MSASLAAPDVAGLAALVRDYFIQGCYPSGSVTPANTLAPSGSLVKAVIFPYFLRRALRQADVRRELEPYVGFTTSVLFGVAGRGRPHARGP